MVTIRGWLLFEGGYYLRVVTIRGWLLFEGGVYFLGKPTDIYDGCIRYVRVRCGVLLDAVSSTFNLSVMVSTVEQLVQYK